MTLEKRVKNLEDFVSGYVSNQSKKAEYDRYDKSGLRQHISEKADSSEVSDAWSEKDLYKADRYVMSDNALWRCLIQNTNSRPCEGSPYWEKVNIAAEFNRLAALINELKIGG